MYRSLMGSQRFSERTRLGGGGTCRRRNRLTAWEATRQISGEAIAGGVTLAFKPWKEIDGAEEYCKTLSADVLANWGILYCGGAGAVEKQLHRTAAEYRLDLHSEAFAW